VVEDSVVVDAATVVDVCVTVGWVVVVPVAVVRVRVRVRVVVDPVVVDPVVKDLVVVETVVRVVEVEVQARPHIISQFVLAYSLSVSIPASQSVFGMREPQITASFLPWQLLGT
jgi:hypothetical protein